MNSLFTRFLALIIMLATLFPSCRKEQPIKIGDNAAINVVNVVVGGKNLKMAQNQNDSVVVNSYKVFATSTGNRSVYVCPIKDSLNPYYNQNKLLYNGDVYSLFLFGLPSSIDTIWKKESLPYYQDSVFGIRFANLCYKSYPVNVNIAGSGSHEFESVSYKSITEFKAFSGVSSVKSYVFEVRRASNDSLISSIRFEPPPRFKDITLVLRGQIDGAGNNSPGILRVDNN